MPYFISGHPGSTLEDMVDLALWLKKNGRRPRQVQDFIPTPMSMATCMYHTGIDPLTMQPVYTATGLREKKLQKALLLYWSPEQWPLAREALREAGRTRPDRAGPRGAGAPGRSPAGAGARIFTEAAMKLSAEQIERFDREGYLFFPACSRPRRSDGSTAECRPSSPSTARRTCARRAATPCAPTSPRTCTATPFARLARHPRMVEPVMQVFGEDVYMHQFKINGKMAFDGDVWQWHQDYGTWKNDDLMPEARAMNVAIFLDEVNEFNGPLMFIPGSHKLGVLDARATTRRTTSYPLWTIDHETIAQARGARRHRGAQGPGGLDDPVPRLPRARLDLQPVAVEPRGGVPEPLRGVEPHPPLQAPRVHRAPRLRALACLPDDCLLVDYPVATPWKDGTPAEELSGVSSDAA